MHFYDPEAGHGLPHDPFKSLVVPRPIGWISSIDAEGRANLAPYSFFNGISSAPPMVMFSSDGRKDSLNNVEATGLFTCNLVTWDLRDRMNATSQSAPPETSEFDLAGLTMTPGTAIDVPRVAECPAALECRHVETVVLKDLDGKPVDSYLVVGQVVGVHIDESILIDGLVDTSKLMPVSRLGYHDYSVVREVFSLKRPV